VGEPITVVVADDHALVRDMLCDQFASNGFDVAACTGRTDEAMALVARIRPDILILDIDMPGPNAFHVAARIHDLSPTTKVLFLSGFVHDRYVQQALACEASGYLTKSEPPGAVVRAVRKIVGGAAQYSAEVADRIVIGEGGAHLAPRRQSRADLLTSREREVLQYVARGLLQKQIARRMGVSVKTVQAHVANLMEKLDIHDRVELARFAIREGFVEP
jgi:DNA-binding NarL/FixJ family response regulator